MKRHVCLMSVLVGISLSGTWTQAHGQATPDAPRPNGNGAVYPTPSNNGTPPFEIRPTRVPPPVPPKRPVPLNQTLRQKAADLLVEMTRHETPVLRANAIEGLQRSLGGDGARSSVIRGLSDDSPIVRFASCVACGDLRYADTRPVLLKLAYDPDPNVRLAARYALHKLGDSSLTQEMLLGLRDDRPGVRGNTAMLLGMLGEKSAISILQKHYTDSAEMVRLQIAEALWRLGDKDASDKLIAWTLSPYGSEQVVALLALAQPRRVEALPYVRGLMVADFPEVELAAARCAGMLGSDEGMGIALKYWNSKDHRQRGLAALALGDIARSDAQDTLSKLLEDPNADVRISAATALLKLRAP